MKDHQALSYIEKVLENVPSDWLNLTTHRLDIYHEELAKTEFIDEFEKLFREDRADEESLKNLPTAYDYIRLGHPLSSVLEWAIARMNNIKTDNVISFSSQTMPVFAILRTNKLKKKKTRILYSDDLYASFDERTLRAVYGYSFDLERVADQDEITPFEGSTIYLLPKGEYGKVKLRPEVDFYVNKSDELGSILFINDEKNDAYVPPIQHVRRRETIAMTPSNCYAALQQLAGSNSSDSSAARYDTNLTIVRETIKRITNAHSDAVIGSSGLSVQYAIMMGLIDDAMKQYPEREIKFLVPPNCYGGTNDQARRVAAAIDRVEVLDLPVDGDNDMVDSINRVLDEVAEMDAVPYIIAEIPTNPRVEVPDLEKLRAALSKTRKAKTGEDSVCPVFILDQTFCPNVQFLGDDGILASISTISYVSGSKFPSGGKCTAGYCVANDEAAQFMDVIEKHMKLCDNEATPLQMEILAGQMPSMIKRIQEAFVNTREFVNFIQETLPEAKINFVSEELAERGFTPSVFSLDLPTKGDSEEQREAYKRGLNHKLIKMMITEIPDDSKYCVSYGQLKGCYWTIPATSTQGTTKESDKDYIARVSVSPDLDLEKHKEVFKDFVKAMD